MRFDTHRLKSPVWTRSDYGEPEVTYGSPVIVHMKLAENTRLETSGEGSRYMQCEFIGLTRESVSVGSLIDDKYIVKYVLPGRITRVFMDYAEGKDRTYVE